LHTGCRKCCTVDCEWRRRVTICLFIRLPTHTLLCRCKCPQLRAFMLIICMHSGYCK
jgi:hypothetical protein